MAFPKGNPYLTLRDTLGPIFSDLDFVALFSQHRTARSATVAISVDYGDAIPEELSDRQTADAVRYGLTGNTC